MLTDVVERCPDGGPPTHEPLAGHPVRYTGAAVTGVRQEASADGIRAAVMVCAYSRLHLAREQAVGAPAARIGSPQVPLSRKAGPLTRRVPCAYTAVRRGGGGGQWRVERAVGTVAVLGGGESADAGSRRRTRHGNPGRRGLRPTVDRPRTSRRRDR
ncbi:hypothetical protein GCM10023084_15460 [Streptomyces lacrimifluminis]|uniref:Uncharacterized protein n=1 Tax=Streptomyces lacrimifluminis TaxID=1500077 RepID=A0A917KL02_9ACTN|nr:hypothetical protein GCM10012282_11250 [Streptomyces lacrimifluminis]